MNLFAASVYVVCILILFVKFMVTSWVLARERLSNRSFRYEEDARYWRGKVAADSELATRAQRLLRNDGESQIYFFVLGAMSLFFMADVLVLICCYISYVASRCVHAWYLLHGRQPHRNRAFVCGILTIVVMAAHLVHWPGMVDRFLLARLVHDYVARQSFVPDKLLPRALS
jgi:uncharacterized membrane protein YecN with MAPEG domain